MKKGPQPQGRSWTLAEDAQLLNLLSSRMDKILIARKLKRTVLAITKRKSVLKTQRMIAPNLEPKFEINHQLRPRSSRAE